MEDPSEEWETEEYSCEGNGGKMSWLLNNGLGLGKKVLITGIVVSSTPLVIPPLLAISAIGFVVSIPSGLLLASYACSERLMTKLLPGPALPSHLLDFGLASDDEEVEEEGEGCEGDIGMEKEEEEQMKETKRGVEMRIELVLREGKVTKGNNFGVKKDEQGLIEDVDDILEENSYEEDGGECLDEEEETPLEKMIKAKHLGPREDEKEEPVIEENDEQPVDGAEKGLVVVIEDVGDCLGEKEETPLEEMIEVKPLGLREDEKEEPVIEEKRNEQPVDEGTKGVLVVIEEYEESGNSIKGLETPFEVATVVVLEEIGSNERVNDIEAVEEDKQYEEERQGGTEEGEQKIVKNAEVMQIPNEDKHVHSMVEMDGSLEELREEEVPKVGEKMLETRYMEIIDAVPKEAQAIEKKGEGKTVVNNEQAEKPIVEISETINVLIGPMGMTLVEKMREEEDVDYIKEADVSMGDGNVEQKFVLDKGATLQGGGVEDNYLAGDANQDLQLNNEKEIVISSNADVREIADESGLDLLDEKNEAGKQYAYVVHGTPKESLSYTGSEDIKSLEHQDPAAVDESSHKGISLEKDITVPSNEMSPTKHSASKKSSKRPRTNSENFRSTEANMAYNGCHKRAIIIMERIVRMETLENTAIPKVFKERTWTKLLNPSGNVYVELIREFFSNATVEGDHINCWVQQKEFVITRDSIQEFLEVCPPSQPISVHYDDRLDSLEPMAELLGGSLKKKSMNTIPFNAVMRTLTYVMIHNLYLVTNLTTLFGRRTIFLYDLYTHKEIDICRHIYHLLTKSITKRNSRTIFPFLTLIMGLIAKTKLKIPSGLTMVQRDYPIGANTVTRSKAHVIGSRIGVSQIPRDDVEEEGGDTEEEIEWFTLTLGGLYTTIFPSTSTGARLP